ncbi:hypothetical protein [Virgibacillus halodenitrificans]|uniref:hypothetical protein n=1 Tax=Virgibacillus halodenitrificans TaxID=1482 RepID=UPI00030FB296|nr:hypothetical protein [Virgibacillus halodenitrificans]
MNYLTHTEYQGLGFTEMDPNEFERLIKKASDVIDNATRFFYRTNELETDVSIRKEQFKKAIAAQVEYFNEIGSTTDYGMNEPSSVQIGRTSMSAGGRNSNQAQKNSVLSNDAADYLHSVGLLYRGLG